MNPQRHQRIREIFEAAVSLDGPRRGRYLDEACGGDSELRAEVEAILRGHEATGEFLNTPLDAMGLGELASLDADGDDSDGDDADGDDADGLEAHPPGTCIGRYEIVRIIARGGMGIVYEAMQDQPRRTVALKVMRRGVLWRSETRWKPMLRRFREEANILARLRHPNIAQVYDAGMHYEEGVRGRVGTPSGVRESRAVEGTPFFAMEYVPDALPITEYAARHNLSSRQRLEMFAKVCDAIHHGHQKGIIHRDIKPANILVPGAWASSPCESTEWASGQSGGKIAAAATESFARAGIPCSHEPKVIDFGVARATDADLALTQQTRVGQLIGTIQYMSPEQCDADPHDLDSRSDVYSLGIVLYELLAGVPAYDTGSTTIYQATCLIKETVPPPLSQFDRRLRGDVETIVFKAIEKDRTRRYQSAEALREDIERHLAGEPVEARRQSAWVKTTRWMGRHPIATTAAGAVVVAGAVLATTLVIVWYGLTRPSYFRYVDEGRVAHLMTPLGKVVATLGGGADIGPNSVRAGMYNRPARFGGGRVALFFISHGEQNTGGQLWMSELHDLLRPVWSTRPDEPEAPELPPPWNAAFEVTPFRVTHYLVANVMPEYAGDEIIVVQNDAEGNAQVIRCYDFGGKILFEAWHLGHLSSIHWWAEPRLLVCIGERHGRPEIAKYGYDIPPPWPVVVYAVRPADDVRVGWVNQVGSLEEWPVDGNIGEVVPWYKVLVPREVSNAIWPGRRNLVQYQLGAGKTSVGADFSLTEYDGFTFWLTPEDDVIKRVPADRFRQSEWWDRWPQIDLVDWPPPMAER